MSSGEEDANGRVTIHGDDEPISHLIDAVATMMAKLKAYKHRFIFPRLYSS